MEETPLKRNTQIPSFCDGPFFFFASAFTLAGLFPRCQAFPPFGGFRGFRTGTIGTQDSL